jgi:hypothetical protein
LLGLYIVWDAPYKTVGNRVEVWGVALVDEKIKVISWPKFILTVAIIAVGWLPLLVWVFAHD